MHEVEEAGPIKLTRRGKAVAVLMAESEYERLKGGKVDFWASVETFRATHDVKELAATEIFKGLRDQGTGRETPW